jgi:predicted XRE-type DNA-binding protein
MSKTKDEGCTPSSGNIFADLGLPEPDQDRYKADLIHTIADIIRRRELTQAAAADILGIDQPKVSSLMHGRISGFTTDRLLRFLALLGYHVRISVEKTDKGAVSVEQHI